MIRAFIRTLGINAKAQGVSLRDVIEATMAAKVKDATKGKVLVGVTAGGVSSTFQLETLGITASDISALCSDLLDYLNVSTATDDAGHEEFLRAQYEQLVESRCNFNALQR